MREQEYSTKEAAAFLDISRQSMLSLAKRHRIGRRIGSYWVFTQRELDKWLAMPRTRRGPKKLDPAGKLVRQ